MTKKNWITLMRIYLKYWKEGRNYPYMVEGVSLQCITIGHYSERGLIGNCTIPKDLCKLTETNDEVSFSVEQNYYETACAHVFKEKYIMDESGKMEAVQLVLPFSPAEPSEKRYFRKEEKISRAPWTKQQRILLAELLKEVNYTALSRRDKELVTSSLAAAFNRTPAGMCTAIHRSYFKNWTKEGLNRPGSAPVVIAQDLLKERPKVELRQQSWKEPEIVYSPIIAKSGPVFRYKVYELYTTFAVDVSQVTENAIHTGRKKLTYTLNEPPSGNFTIDQIVAEFRNRLEDFVKLIPNLNK